MHLKKKRPQIKAVPFQDLSFESQINQVDALVNDTRRLLSEDDIQELEDVRNSLEALAHWMSCYRTGLAAANRLSTRGSDILRNIKDRLEDKAHSSTEQAEMLNQSLRRLEKLMFPVGQMFCVQPLSVHE